MRHAPDQQSAAESGLQQRIWVSYPEPKDVAANRPRLSTGSGSRSGGCGRRAAGTARAAGGAGGSGLLGARLLRRLACRGGVARRLLGGGGGGVGLAVRRGRAVGLL